MSFQGYRVYFVAFSLFLMENPVSKYCSPDQTPHYMASDLCLHSLLLTRLRIPGKDGLNDILKELKG